MLELYLKLKSATPGRSVLYHDHGLETR